MSGIVPEGAFSLERPQTHLYLWLAVSSHLLSRLITVTEAGLAYCEKALYYSTLQNPRPHSPAFILQTHGRKLGHQSAAHRQAVGVRGTAVPELQLGLCLRKEGRRHCLRVHGAVMKHLDLSN